MEQNSAGLQTVPNSANLPALPEMMKNPDFFKQVVLLMRQTHMIARLGDGDVFFMTEAGQNKRAFRVKVNLEYGKHFAFPAGPAARSMILGEGYDFINQYSGIEIIRPKTLMAHDGSERGNPYFERDEKSGSLNSIFIRGLAIGYSPTGNLVAIDKTIFVNLSTLLVQEIQAKVKKNPSLGQMGTRDQRPSEIIYYKSEWKESTRGKRYCETDSTPTTIPAVGAWHFIALTGDLGYWVNISHPEIQSAFESFIQKQRFLDRSAGTILNRLLLAQHPAIATKTPIVTELIIDPNDNKKIASAKAHVFVFGFTADSNPKQKRDDIVAMADRLARGEDAANMSIKLEKTDITEVTTEAEIVDSNHAEADPSEIQIPSDDDSWGEGRSDEAVPSIPETESDGTPTTPEGSQETAKETQQTVEAPLRFFACSGCAKVHTVNGTLVKCSCGSKSLKEHPTLAAAQRNARIETPAEKLPEVAAATKTTATETKASKSETKASSGARDLTKFLNDKNTDRKTACLVRDELGFEDFTALRNADAKKLAEFFSLYDVKAANGATK